ncbi:hypothetical protein ACJX0J_023452, partial [Zea mays]
TNIHNTKVLHSLLDAYRELMSRSVQAKQAAAGLVARSNPSTQKRLYRCLHKKIIHQLSLWLITT